MVTLVDPLAEIRHWLRVIEDAKRTVLCAPGMENQLQALINDHGMEHLWTVQVSEHVPDGEAYVINAVALDPFVTPTSATLTLRRNWRRA